MNFHNKCWTDRCNKEEALSVAWKLVSRNENEGFGKRACADRKKLDLNRSRNKTVKSWMLDPLKMKRRLNSSRRLKFAGFFKLMLRKWGSDYRLDFLKTHANYALKKVLILHPKNKFRSSILEGLFYLAFQMLEKLIPSLFPFFRN